MLEILWKLYSCNKRTEVNLPCSKICHVLRSVIVLRYVTKKLYIEHTYVWKWQSQSITFKFCIIKNYLLVHFDKLEGKEK